MNTALAWRWGLVLFGLANVANGLWMLAAPAAWYVDLPAAVPDFGPLNEHFVRDIGAAYLTFGVGLVWSGFRASARPVVLGLTAAFYVLHALGHVHDTAGGVVGREHWWIDFPAIYLPAIVLVALWIRIRSSGEAPTG